MQNWWLFNFAAEYYLKNKEAIKEKSKNQCKNLSHEEKNKIKEYHGKRYQQLIPYKKGALQNKLVLFLLSIKMSEKSLQFDNTTVKKNEFRKSKQSIDLDLVHVYQIVVSDKFKHNDDGFQHFLSYKEGEIVKPLCIILPQMSGYIKYFDKYKEVWDKIKEKLNIKFQSMAVYETYIKAKVRESDGVIKTNFLGGKKPKEMWLKQTF